MKGNLNLELPPKILQAFYKRGNSLYVVGGAIRDALMGFKPSEIEFATDANFEELMEIAETSDFSSKFSSDSYKNGIVTFIEKGKSYRISRIKENNHETKKITFSDSIWNDLDLRDFTINALAFNTFTNNIVDHGTGKQDIKDKVLRFVRKDSSSVEVLRAYRYLSQFGKGWKIFYSFIPGSISLKDVPKNVIREELIKLFSYKPAFSLYHIPSPIRQQIFKGAYYSQFGSCSNHAENLHTHALITLREAQRLSKNPFFRMAAYLHDVGKINHVDINKEGHITSYKSHEEAGANIVKEWMESLEFSPKQINYVCGLIKNHKHPFLSIEAEEDEILSLVYEMSPLHMDDLIDLRLCDFIGNIANTWGKGNVVVCGHLKEKWRSVFNNSQRITIKELKVSGKDVMKILNVEEGPQVGRVLGDLKDMVEGEILENDRNVLLSELREMEMDGVGE